MIIEQLVLQNFGTYGGRQVLDLAPPSPQKPVILFGGYNGGGKTTLLDALQLSLYGKLARCSNRGELAYDEFLGRSIHWGTEPSEGAALEIQVRRMIEGRAHVFRVHRSWSVRGESVREKLEVLRNGELDPVLTEAWAEQVDEFLPVRLSNFFFFDGEKIESLADLGRSTEVLTTAINSLLGLDLVDQLTADLMVLERRKRAEHKGAEARAEIESAKAELDRLAQVRATLAEERASAQNGLDYARKRLREAEERYRLSGGDAYERRVEFEAEQRSCKERLARSEDALRDLAGGIAPLLLLRDLVDDVRARADAEESARTSRAVVDALATRDAEVVRFVKAFSPGAQLVRQLDRHLAEDRKRRAPRRGDEQVLRLSPDGMTELTLAHSGTGEVRALLDAALREHETAQAALGKVDRQLASAPDREALAKIFQARAEAMELASRAEERLRAIDGELEKVTRAHEGKWDAFSRSTEEAVHEQFEREATSRIVTHSAATRQSLQQFRSAVVQRHVRRIETLVLESFRQLLRKEALVADLRIDPATFVLSLYGNEGRLLSPERLSAGERQLLAVSIIWGLARASGRPLPAVIDTPLGRLDSHHRSHLVERYFPHASHQVLLLSTDKEIDEHYYAKLKPSVGRAYHLDSDPQTGATRIESGYFW
ncbi:MAG TPA: DNA sulfur modification protein DndD [Polyangiaceae bacterium]